MSLQLLVLAGLDKGKALPLHDGPDLMLGRSVQAHYQINDPRASRSHCQILKDGDVVTLVCAGGSGGTFVNGHKVQRQILKPGDVIRVGDTQLRLQVGDQPPNDASTLAPGAMAAAPAATSATRLESLKGQTLSHYAIGEILGTGNSGIVFHATDTKDGRAVALKVLQPEFAENDEEMQRFVRAMKTMLPLRHANLVTLLAAGKTGPHCWVAMEHVEGESVTQMIQRIGVAGMLDWRQTLRLAVHVARALEYAHGQNIIHRNIAPPNILVRAADKVAKLGDLMLAKALEGTLARQVTRPGELLGDINYMSPERTRGTADVDGRSDIYSLGATVYALLAGRPPFADLSLVETITKIRKVDPEPPRKFQMALPGLIEGPVLRMLAKRPEDRYQTAGELVTELERVAKFQGVPL
ncbi:MAG TPA: FHA domain-containing serine/threonine-protein kinase [Gemmataceae bacterium]|nr:FHA domain-containing serine/threonine-protein kinase [Gemmataceae bacterium]